MGTGRGRKERRCGFNLSNSIIAQNQQRNKKRWVRIDNYDDENGILSYQVIRTEPKDFIQRRPKAGIEKPDNRNKDHWEYKTKGTKPLPQKLPRILQAFAQDDTVFIGEGEKVVAALEEMGLTATTNHGGAGKWTSAHTQWFPPGARVVILPDNDQVGEQHAQGIAKQLYDKGCKIKIVRLPDLPPKGDVVDWVGVGGTKDKLIELIKATPEYTKEDRDWQREQDSKVGNKAGGNLPQKQSSNTVLPKAEEVHDKCNFLKYCRDNAATLPEPLWVIQLSNLARCEDGERICHEVSSPHPKYNPEETDKKIRHVLEDSSGPITCEFIRANYSDICGECGHSVTAPIHLSSPNSLPAAYKEWRQLLDKTGRYSILGRGILCYLKYNARGELEEVPVANFIARPTREISRDDGREVEKSFEVEGILTGGIPLPPVSVSAKEFSNMSWVAGTWGLRANVEPGSGAKDRVRHCIQSMAFDVQRETIYTHTGWRRIDSRWVYLHAGGAVGAEGIKCEPGEGLQRYILPDIAGGREAMEWSLKLLDVAPAEIVVPLFSMVYLAPLCEPLRQAGIEPAFILWLTGITGAKKSTLAALFLSHYGNFSAKNLPGSFKDTDNALEKRGFLAKDTLLIVDDFHPVSDRAHALKMQKTSQCLLRAYGDRVGRTRMRADASIREGFPPRGLCVVTGEDLPDAGQSTTARFLATEVAPGVVDTELLTECQANVDKLSAAMRGFLEFISPSLDAASDFLRDSFYRHRLKAATEGQHGRIPETVAWLFMGFITGLDYALHVKAISIEEKKELLDMAWEVLLKLADNQARRISDERPTEKFLNVLRELLESGTAYVKDVFHDNTAGSEPGFLGWLDDDWMYLLPEVTYKAISQFCSQQGAHFPVTARTLWKHLDTEGLLFTEKNGSEVRRLIKATLPHGRIRVLKLKADAIKN